MNHEKVTILAKGDGWSKIDEIKNLPIEERGPIYGTNDCFLRTPEVDITFHMHDLEEYFHDDLRASSTRLCMEHANANPEKPFISLYEWEKVPHCQAYPLQEIIDHFGVCYFSSSVEYMIAYALYHGCKEINFYGVNMSDQQEYIEQKPGVEFWCGLATGMGCKINYQHEYTSLLKTKNGKLYGYFVDQWVE